MAFTGSVRYRTGTSDLVLNSDTVEQWRSGWHFGGARKCVRLNEISESNAGNSNERSLTVCTTDESSLKNFTDGRHVALSRAHTVHGAHGAHGISVSLQTHKTQESALAHLHSTDCNPDSCGTPAHFFRSEKR